MNPTLDKLEQGRTDAKIAALKTKAVAAAARARSAAAQAATAQLQTQQIEMENEMKKPELDDALQEAGKAAKRAVEASKEAIAALEEVKTIAKTAIADAKKQAVIEVKKELTASYHKLDEWRNTVLTSPWDRAQKAAIMANKPYNDMIRTFYNRIGQYQTVASDMMAKANGLAADAQGLASGAQGRMEGGDTIGANQDMSTAAAMRKSSAKFAGAANALHGEANNMQKMIAEYVAAGHLAAWNAAYQTDPDALPPPPVNPDLAFTPPPTVLLQKAESSAEVKEHKGEH